MTCKSTTTCALLLQSQGVLTAVAHLPLWQGVATQLICAAEELAGSMGVEHLYVHVRTRNAAGLALYVQRCGFAIERRETESAGQALGRPPRVLLHQSLHQ
jgi:Acetyltransferase (GNAT) family